MINKKIKTAEYQPIVKSNLAKNLDKFTILICATRTAATKNWRFSA